MISLCTLSSFILFLLVACTYTPENIEKEIYLDPTRGIEERVEDLLKRMTLDEKINQMYNHRAGSRLHLCPHSDSCGL